MLDNCVSVLQITCMYAGGQLSRVCKRAGVSAGTCAFCKIFLRLTMSLMLCFFSMTKLSAGALELSEMEDFLAALDKRQASVLPSASRIFTFLDKDLSQAIEFDEFFDWYVTALGDTGADVRTSKLKRKKEIRAIFDEFDTDRSGQWEITEFQAFLDTTDLQTDEAQDIFDALDSDGSGSIDFNEFYEWHTKTF